MSRLSIALRAGALAGLLLVGGGAALARPPEWVKPYLNPGPVAGDHAAVILMRTGDVRYITDDRVRRTYRSAIRVLDASGSNHALAVHALNPNVEKITSAKAWLLAPDGREVASYSMSDFIDMPLTIGRHFWLQHRFISLSAAGKIVPGGVFVWEFQVESQAGIADVNWSFDSSLPVQRTVFEVTPMPGGRLEWYATTLRLPAPAAGSAPGGLRWETGATQPAKGDKPSGFLPEPQSVFARAVNAQGAGGIRTWGDFARLSAEVIEPRIALTPEVKTRAESTVADKTARWEKIRALCAWVQREIAYLSVSLDRDYLAGYRPHPADEVLKNRYGDCKDKMTLLIAMLRAIGEQGVPVLVAAGNPVQVRKEWPTAVFNHVIVGIPADEAVPASWPVADGGALGKFVLFDPTDPLTPLGLLPSTDQFGHGLIASPAATELIEMPRSTPEANAYRGKIEATLDETGHLAVTAKEELHGVAAVTLQSVRAQATAEQTRRGLETRLREGATAMRDLKWKDAWDATLAHHQLDFSFKAERYARRAGDLIMVSPQVIFGRGRLETWKTEQSGVAWIGPSGVEKEVRLTLPPGLEIVELPREHVAEVAAARASLTYRKDGDAIIYRCEVLQRGGLLDKESYEQLRTFLLKLHEAERRPIVLRKVASATPSPAATTPSPAAADTDPKK